MEKIAPKRTKLTIISLVDPKGYIPKTVVNFAGKKQASCVIELKKSMENPIKI